MYYANCACRLCTLESRWRLKHLRALYPEVVRHIAPADYLLAGLPHNRGPYVTKPLTDESDSDNYAEEGGDPPPPGDQTVYPS